MAMPASDSNISKRLPGKFPCSNDIYRNVVKCGTEPVAKKISEEMRI